MYVCMYVCIGVRYISLRDCTVAYMAPEVMQKYNEEGTAVKLDGSKTDVFSFAVLALYVVTGVMPHEGLSNKDIFIKVGNSAKRTPVPPGYFNADADADSEQTDTYPQFVKVVERMWAETPDDRPSFDIILADLNDIFAKEIKNAKSAASKKRAAGQLRRPT